MRQFARVQSSRIFERAELTRLKTVRLCARSAELIDRAVTTRQRLLHDFDGLAALRRARHEKWRRTVARPWLGTIEPLPLTPHMLLEVAGEFQLMADRAAAPETGLAFRALAFSYRALAAGYDTDHVHNHMLH